MAILPALNEGLTMELEFWEVDEEITILPLEGDESGAALVDGFLMMFPEGE